jgi:hypothetical protein
MSDDFKKTWIEGFNELAITLARKYKDNPESVLCAIGYKSVLGSLLETYNNLVGLNEIPRLEDLTEDHKRLLWDKSGQYADEQFKRIAICKCIYLLDILTAYE